MFKQGIFLVLSHILLYSAHAQVQPHGTIVVIYLSEDKVAMAADSRSSSLNPFSGAPDDKQCKLTALGEHMLFGSLGVTGWFPDTRGMILAPQFDHVEEAIKAFGSAKGKNRRDVLLSTAHEWAEHLMARWKVVNIFDPISVSQVAKWGNGRIAQGYFASVMESGKPIVLEVNITFDARSRSVSYNGSDISCTNFICASGLPDITVEYRDGLTPRARASNLQWADARKLIDAKDRPLADVERLVRLTIEQADTFEVGGPIDSAEIGSDGRIRWFNRKESCPENSN
jgi:hypothetical protein